MGKIYILVCFSCYKLVFNHLLMHGWEVTVGILKVGEIDFVAVRGADRVYIQVAYMLSSDETVEREFGNLAAIRDNYPKMVVSMDPFGGEFPRYPGIRHYSLRIFLQLEGLK